jgi:hypothetical protein
VSGWFWRASFETRNFRFEAYGRTRHEAVELIRAGWEKHRAATGATTPWEEIVPDVQTVVVAIGAAYRDGEVIE